MVSPITNPHIMVIDPGVKTPEIDTYNNIAKISPVACTYHLPALFGFDSFPEDPRQTRAIIILGSLASVFDRLPWQQQLEHWTRKAIDAGVPILGCCYGHQMLGWMHGATLGYVREDRAKLQGARSVTIAPNPIWTPGPRDLIVTHCEMVTGLPREMRPLASSPEVAVDGLMLENKPVFGFQSHPEATFQFLKDREMHTPQAVNVLGQGHQLIAAFVHMAVGNHA
jgi:GMP synthase-like glutamine amidotransferase